YGAREEREVDQPLRQPLCPLRERIRVREVEVAEQVHDEEAREEAEEDRRRARDTPTCRPDDERADEEDREHVGERHRPGEAPVHLLERDAEDARKEQKAREAPHCVTCSSTRSKSSDRARRDTLRRQSSASGASSSSPARQRARSSPSAPTIPSTSSGATTKPAPAPRIKSAAAPSGGTTARIGRSAARYSNTLPLSTPLPRPPASGIRSSRASESRCNSSERRRGAYGISSSRSPSPRPSAHSRSAARKSPRNRTTTSSKPERSSAVRNGRGSRLPKNEPVCVSRKRSDGCRSRPAKSSKSEPFAIVVTVPRGFRSRTSSAIASETHVIASAERAIRRATACSPCSFARTTKRSARRCGCATTESRRSATQRTPVARFT